jgi:hypothetical protein
MSGVITKGHMFQGDYVRYNGASQYGKELNQKSMLLSENVRLNEAVNKKNTFKDGISKSIMNNNTKLNILENVRIRGAERAFAFYLCEAYYQSVVLDSDFKKINENQIRSYFIDNLKKESNNNIYGYMNECASKTERLSKLVEACKSKGKKLEAKASKKLDESDGDFDIDDFFDEVEVDFNDSDDDTMDVDYEKADVSEISNAVKDKVIQVVKDEEDRNKESEQFIQDINNAKTVSENTGVYSRTPEQFTLFKSMMMKNYKETVKAVKDGALSESAYGTINEQNEIKVDMDYVLCDTILEYTNMELYNTLRMKTFSSNDLRKLAESLAYTKVE